MVQKIHTYWAVFWQFRAFWLANTLEYRASFFFWSTVSLMWSLFNLLFFSLLISVTGSIGGWTKPEMYILLGVFTLFEAMMWSVFYHNMTSYVDSIYDGTLSMILLKPLDTQFILMVRNNSYNNVSRIILSVFLFYKGFSLLGSAPSVTQILWGLSLFSLSGLFIYFLWFLLSTLGFYVERLRNINEIIPSLDRTWRFPASMYRGIFSLIFVVVIPLGIVTSVPAAALMGTTDWTLVIRLAVYTLLLFIASRIFFQYSLRRYAGVAN